MVEVSVTKGVKCPKCGGQRIWAKGLVPSRSGLKQRYVCYTGGHTFYKPVPKPKPRPVRKAKAVKKVAAVVKSEVKTEGGE